MYFLILVLFVAFVISFINLRPLIKEVLARNLLLPREEYPHQVLHVFLSYVVNNGASTDSNMLGEMATMDLAIFNWVF